MTGLTRRDFLAGAATAAGALAVGGRAAAAPATFDGTLRVLGLSVGQAAYDPGRLFVANHPIPPAHRPSSALSASRR